MSSTLFGADEPGAVRRVSLVKLASELARATAAIGRVQVEGEVHRPPRGGRGAIYFTLRDRAAQISVVCPAARAPRCRAVAGERVAVTGTLSWAPDRGQLSLVADEVVPVGAGAIAAMIAEARRRLAADGLLDRPRRPLPRLPAMIGVVCGNEAAVRADIESVVAARFPGYPVRFAEVTVSGAGAVDAIVGALRRLDERPDVEVIVLARGGGDATQLLPFSAEDLCRAVCACATPVVSAIGHEGDRPLCDEVADHRFGTPSLAAGAVVPSRAELQDDLDGLWATVDARLERRLVAAATRLEGVDRERALLSGLAVAGTRLERARYRLAARHPGGRVEAARASLAALARQLDALSPARVLERGYAIVRDPAGQVVRRAGLLAVGERIDVQLAVGSAAATIEEVHGG